MNICDYILQNKLKHRILPDGKIKQEGPLVLPGLGITCLKGFVHDGYLDISCNKITSLEGFCQRGPLVASYNQITSLEGFVQNGELEIEYNKITSLKGFIQNSYADLRHNKITSLEGFTIEFRHTIILCGNSIYKRLIRARCDNQERLYAIIYCGDGKIYIKDTCYRLGNFIANSLK
jgi:hypothetical protein